MDWIPVELSFEEHGQGIPLVLVHGFPLNRTIWYPLLPHLKEHARVILPDLRGHGQSPAPEGEYPMRLMAEDLRLLLDRLEIERAVIAGHSMGGYAALAFAQAYPNRLLGFSLIASRVDADSPEKRQNRLQSARDIRRRGVGSLVKKMPEQLTDRPDIAASLREMIASTPTNGVVGSLRGMARRENAVPWLGDLCVPSVVIAGENDQIVPPDEPRTYISFFPKAWLVMLADSGHMPMMEAPERTAAVLIELLHSVDRNQR